MPANTSKPIFSKFSNVVSINIDGKNLKDPKVIAEINKQVEARVKVIVGDLKSNHAKFVDPDFGPTEEDELGASSLYGAVGKVPEPAGSKYPPPEDLRWERPLYDDDHFDEEGEGKKENGSSGSDCDEAGDSGGIGDDLDDEFALGLNVGGRGDSDTNLWCKHGCLFIDGASSGDVIQGNLGDCWYLGALAVMGANETLLKDCFWNGDAFKQYGLFVVRFFKDVQLIYVIIDDRIPVKAKDGRVIFGSCKDPNELWVPLMEKAYAKLHGNYRSLIGGYVHYGLSDMTGYCSKLVTLKPGYPGYNEALTADDVWQMLERYKAWGCLMGTSIQSHPKQERKVEHEAGMGLFMGHAYSLLGIGTIEDKNAPEGHVKLVKLRNPWGKGEWEGAYGDRTDERERAEIQDELERNFKIGNEEVVINFMDGSFFMPFDAWYTRFTSLFVAVNFPPSWTGKRLQGFWSGESGGNREMGSWISNPKFKLTISGEKGTYKHCFIGLYTHDSRLVLGKEYFEDALFSTPLAFDVVTAEDFEKKSTERKLVPSSSKHFPTAAAPAKPVGQAPYNQGDTQLECYLQAGVEYYIVPFLYRRQQTGAYYITSYSESAFELEGGVKVSGESSLMVVGEKSGEAVKTSHLQHGGAHWRNPDAVLEGPASVTASTVVAVSAAGAGAGAAKALASSASASAFTASAAAAPKEKVLSISKAQFYEKAEQLRERFVWEAKRLGVSLSQVKSIFTSDRDANSREIKRSTYTQFKRRLMDIGFSLTDLPDEDLVVLDIDNSGSISPEEFLEFFELGLSFEEGADMPQPPQPPADDLLFKAADLEGVLRVNVVAGRAMRQPAAWFSNPTDKDSKDSTSAAATAAGGELATLGAVAGSGGDSGLQARSVLQYNKAAQANAYSNIFNAHSDSSSSSSAVVAHASGSAQQAAGDGEGLAADDERLQRKLLPPQSSPLKSSQKSGGGGSIAGGSTMTVTNKRHGESVAQSSGIQLHTDAELRDAEVERAMRMQSLRKTILASQGSDPAQSTAVQIDKSGVLRKREKTRSKVEKRDITKDPSSLCFINKRPQLVLALLDGTDTVPAMRFAYAQAGKVCPVPMPVSTSKSSSSSAMHRKSGETLHLQKHGTQMSLPAHFQLGADPFDNTSESTSAIYDIWDVILTKVIIITDSRIGTRANGGKGESLQGALATLKEKRGGLDRSLFLPFLPEGVKANRKQDNVALAKAGADKTLRKGTTPTPRNMKKFPGWASVQTAKQQQQNRENQFNGTSAAAATVSQAFEKLREGQKGQFSEIYRRLINIPVLSNLEKNGDRLRHTTSDNMSGSYLSAFAKRLFGKFDKNLNGFISLDEFKNSLLEMNINVSEEDTITLFNRFETRQKDGTIDWLEFLDFFQMHIVSDMITDWDLDGNADARPRSIIDILLEIRLKAAPVIKYMRKSGLRSIEEYFTKTATGRRPSVLSAKDGESASADPRLPDNCIFHHLNAAHASHNAALLRQLRVRIGIEDMKRVNRVFARNVSAFMAFLQGDDSSRMVDIMKEAHRRVISGFESRVGVSVDGDYGASLNSGAITKLWAILCPQKPTLKFDEMVAIVEDIMLKSLDVDVRHAKTMSNAPDLSLVQGGTSGLMAKAGVAAANEDEDSDNADDSGVWITESFLGVHTELVARCVTDLITQSAWNKSEDERGGGGSSSGWDDDQGRTTAGPGQNCCHNVSYSAFEAYVRYGHVNAIETKLKYLLQLEMSIAGPRVQSLVHAYLNQEQTEMIILVHEPLSGDVTSVSIREDFSALPNAQRLEELCVAQCNKFHRRADVWARGRRYVYTPWETPDEDSAIATIVSRLRIVRTASAREPNELIMVEDGRLVAQLNRLLDEATDLPFFCTCSPTSLYFEVDAEQLSKCPAGLKPLVFQAIRKSKALHSYLVNVMANLNVILTSYNSGVRITMDWKELVAHLTDYRNPYVTVELKPKFLEPYEYVYKPHESIAAYDGEEEQDPLAVQKSSVVTDGGTHPSFDYNFAIKFRPPKLTSCKLLSTEIHKMSVNGEAKFVILMAREAKRSSSLAHNALSVENESFRFLTIYDPRNATDYQCGVLPGCDLYKVLVEGTNSEDVSSPWFNSPASQSLERFMTMVSDAADKNLILLGPAITPHLILTVLNQRGRHVEVLGHCQMSISAVLSGSGVGKPGWNTLTHLEDDGNGKEVLVNAGELQVELGFRKLREIQDEMQAEKARVARRKQQRSAASTPVLRPPPALQRSTGAAAAAAVSGGGEPSLPPAPTNTPALTVQRKQSASSDPIVAAVSDVSAEELARALALAKSEADASKRLEADLHASTERAHSAEQARKEQEETIKALQRQIEEQSQAMAAKDAALQSATLLLREKSNGPGAGSGEAAGTAGKAPVQPASASPGSNKSPRPTTATGTNTASKAATATGKPKDKESVSAPAAPSAGAMSAAELQELQDLRAFAEKARKDAEKHAEAEEKREKELKKLSQQLAKTKDAAAKEKSALEEQLVRETAEKEKLIAAATAAAAAAGNNSSGGEGASEGNAATSAGGATRVAKDIKGKKPTPTPTPLSASSPAALSAPNGGRGDRKGGDAKKQLNASESGDISNMSVSGSAIGAVGGAGAGNEPATAVSALASSAPLPAPKSPPRQQQQQRPENAEAESLDAPLFGGTGAGGAEPGSGQTPVDWGTIPLPSGWESKLDENTGRWFYVDHVNKKTQWRHPLHRKNK